MLMPFSDDIWLADGPSLVAAMGFHFPTRMAVIRMSDGGLLVWSPVSLTAPLRDAVESLGEVRHIVAPNSLHHMSVPEWAAAFPEAQLYAAPGLREKRPDIAFDVELGEQVPEPWRGEIDMSVVRGNALTTEAVLFHAKSGTVLITDLIQQMPKGWYSGWRAVVAKLDLMTASTPTVPRKFRVAFRDRTAARAAVRSILAWPAVGVIMAHAPPITNDGKAFLTNAFNWLKV